MAELFQTQFYFNLIEYKTINTMNQMNELLLHLQHNKYVKDFSKRELKCNTFK